MPEPALSRSTPRESGATGGASRLVAIDALRGLAALVVLAYHARSQFWIGIRETWRVHGIDNDWQAWLGYLTAPLYFGGLGVPLFFVLSGYCVHRAAARSLSRDPAASMNWREFAARRMWRIYPTYVAALLLTAAVDTWVVAAHPEVALPSNDDSPWALLVNLLSLQGLAGPVFGSNVPFWTLSIELHLYLAYPILLACRRRWGPERTLAFAFLVSLLAAAAMHWIDVPTQLPYAICGGPFFLPFWFTWAMGMFLADVEAGSARIPRGSAWLVAMSFVAGPLLQVVGEREFAELGYAVLFGGVVQGSLSARGQRFWDRRWGHALAAVGLFSFSLYATHMPVLVWMHALVGPAPHPTVWPTVAACIVCVLAARGFFELVERWSLRPIATWRPQRRETRSAALPPVSPEVSRP